MAEGWVSSRLGLAGIPAVAEEAMVARDIALAELTGGRLHVAHLSSAGSVALVRQAKSRGVSLTAEVCPHHLLLTEDWVLGSRGDQHLPTGVQSYDTSTKVYPPLRTHEDVAACIAGLADGAIDCVATDHAPHDRASKECTYDDAAFGISVLETALGTLMETVRAQGFDLAAMIDRLTVGPARVLGDAYAPRAKPGRQHTRRSRGFRSKCCLDRRRFQVRFHGTQHAAGRCGIEGKGGRHDCKWTGGVRGTGFNIWRRP